MIPRTLAAALIFTFCLCTPAAALDQVDRLIPADAGLAAAVHDLPGTSQRWASSPLVQLWNDPAMRAFFAPMHAELADDSIDEKVLEETGYTVDELIAMAPGGVAVYIQDFAGFIDLVESDPDFDDPTRVDAALLLGAGDHADQVEALLVELIEREAEETDDEGPVSVQTTLEYRDVVLNVEQRIDLEEPRDEISWAMCEGTLVVATHPDHLRTVIDRILDGSSDNLPASGSVGQTDIGAADAYVHLDLAPFAPVIQEGIAEGLAADNPAGLDAEVLVESLGLNALGSLTFSIGMDGQTTRVDMGFTMSDNVGLMKVLAFENRPLERVPGIPANAVNFAVTHWDLQASWDAIEEIANTINPMYLAMASGWFTGWQEAQGLSLDLRRDLLENIGPTMLSIQLPMDGGDPAASMETLQDQVLVFDVLDREALERLIGALRTGVSEGNELFETREFLGVDIHTVKEISPDAATPRVGYAVTDSHFFFSVGAGHALEETLATRARPDAPSAWDQPDVVRALASMPDSVASMAYQETGAWFELVFEVMSMVAATEDDVFIDPEAAPPAEVIRKHLGPTASYMTKDANGFHMRALILPPGETS
jgi:hypothetical protein